MLDAFLSFPRLIEIDHVDVAVPPGQAYVAARYFDLGRSPLVRALFFLRTLPERITSHVSPPSLSLRLADICASTAPGFRILADEPGVGFAMGAIGRFWETEIPFADVTPASFAKFDEPDFGKVAWALSFKPWGKGGTRIILELRVGATSEEAWAKQRSYFRLIGPFSHFIRRHCLSLLAQDLGGFDADEQNRVLAGDELILEPKAQATHGITIKAPPERIWPWLVQMGCRRGGWYSYDRLDNGAVPSAREGVPELQPLQVGDVLAATPEGEDGFTVLRMDPMRALVLGGTFDLETGRSVPGTAPLPGRYWRVSWAFVLETLDGETTRLRVRGRASFGPESAGWRDLWVQPVHHFMQAEQLRNLKRRAEGHLPHSADTWHDVGEGIVGALGMMASLATPFLRRHRSHFGIDEEAAARSYPGDEWIAEPKWSWTHGVEINASAEAVWPWVVQIGQDKAGFYSYQWLENLIGCDIENAERVHPRWQALRPGDALRLHPTGAAPLTISNVEPGRFFVACGEMDSHTGGPPSPEKNRRHIRVSWLFFIEPLGSTRTRFISRFRIAYGADWLTQKGYGPFLIEPIGFMMDRRMLRGVKERAERNRSFSLSH